MSAEWVKFLVSLIAVQAVALIGVFLSRSGVGLTNKTKIDEIYMTRLQKVEERLDAKDKTIGELNTIIDALRIQNQKSLAEIDTLKQESMSLRATEKNIQPPPMTPGAF